MKLSIANLKKADFGFFFAILVLGLIFNILALKSAILGLISGVLWLFLFISGILGVKFWPRQSNIISKSLGLFLSLNLVIFLSSVSFYLFNFGEVVKLLIFIVMSGLGMILILKSDMRLGWQSDFFSGRRGGFFYALIYLLLLVWALFLLISNQTSQAIRSPWEVLPVVFFIVYFLMSAVLVKILLFSRRDNVETRHCLVSTENLELILISLHLFLTLIIAVIIYKIGFGFDPFVHRAAEYKLAELGYILPKPFYYLGQYTLVVWLSKIFWLPITLIDKILVPGLAAILLPATAYYSLQNILTNRKLLLIASCCLLVVVTPLFFYTVPQSLANLFLLVLVFLIFCHSERNKIERRISGVCQDKNSHTRGMLRRFAPQHDKGWWYWLIVIVIFLIHPLAGIPAAIILVLKNGNIKTLKLKYLLFILMAILIPLFFILASLISNFSLSFSLKNLVNLGGLFNNLLSYLPFYSVYHLVYLFEYNWLILFGLILIVGSYYLVKIKQKKLLITNYQLLITLIINLFLLGFFEFKSVIDYEQAEFVKRLGQIIILVLSPLFLVGVYFILSKVIQLKWGKGIVVILTASVLTISLYLSYPHVDAFNKERGYSVSAADIKAVHLINLDGFGKDFVVLSNQSTAAASLQEFGFKKYYESKCQMSNVKCQMLFYYPIPTSSLLYDLYLKMVYDQPRIDYINQARQLTGVKRVYFVINDYWLDAQKRIEQARQIADLEINIDNQVWVFRFD